MHDLETAQKKVEKYLTHHIPGVSFTVLELNEPDSSLQSIEKSAGFQSSSHKNEFSALLHHYKAKDHDGLLGISVKPTFLDLKRFGKDSVDALIVLRPPRDKKERDYEHIFFHHLWHLLDLIANTRGKGAYVEIKKKVYAPMLSRLDVSNRNMQADIFASVMLSYLGRQNAIHDIAVKYADASLRAIANAFPEKMPFLCAADITREALKIHQSALDEASDPLKTATRITEDVATILGLSAVKTWQKYCVSAQELIWNDIPKEQVLGAAIDLCSDPDIRMCAQSVSDYLEMDVPRMEKTENWYNAFAEDHIIENLHAKYVDYSFQMCMERAMTSGQGQAFFDLANVQNEQLAKGFFFGWCASALQSVGKFFENGTFQGDLPKELAKINFEGARKDYKMSEIQQLSRILLNERRKGRVIDVQMLYNFLKNKKINPVIKNSVKQTLIDLNQYEEEAVTPIDSEIKQLWEKYGEKFADHQIRQL